MAKNYFGVPQLNEEQHKIAKFLKIESTDTIGILVGLIKTYPDAHWLVAGWLTNLLVSDHWGSSWSEVFSDLAKHFGNEQTDLTGAERLRGLILERIYDNNDANLAELLEEIASVFAGGACVAAIQPKVEYSRTGTACNEQDFVVATKAVVNQMLAVIEQREFSTDPALVWSKETKDELAILASHTAMFSRNLVYDRKQQWGEYNNWWEFVGSLIDTMPDLTTTVGPSRDVDNQISTLACLVTALNILSGRNYDQDIQLIFQTPGASPDLKRHWDSAITGTVSYLPKIMQIFTSGVIGVLEIKEQLKNQATLPTRPSFTGFAGPIAYTSIPEGESVVQAAKNDTKEAVAMAFKMRVGIPSTKLLLVDLFFQPANHPNRSTWLPLEYDKVDVIKHAKQPAVNAKEETKVVASFVRAFMANLKEADVTGVTFFQAYWLMQAATKKSFQNVLDRYSRFYPDTAVLSASWEVDRLKELFKDKKNLEVFWKTAKDFISQ